MSYKLPSSLTLELIEHGTNLCNILLENIKTDKKNEMYKTLLDSFIITEEEAKKIVVNLNVKKDTSSGLESVEDELSKILELLNISRTKTVRNYETLENGEKKKVDNKYVVSSIETVDLDYNDIKVRMSAIKSKLNKKTTSEETETSN